MNDLNTDSTNKQTTTAAPNNTATKGYKLENSTDDEVHLSSIFPINVPTSTTEVSVKDVDIMFDPIVGGLEPNDVTFRPLISVTDNLIPNHSMVDALLMENGTIPWPMFENITVICQMNRDCSPEEFCIYGQCKGLCGPQKHDNCFSGTLPRDIFCKYILNPLPHLASLNYKVFDTNSKIKHSPTSLLTLPKYCQFRCIRYYNLLIRNMAIISNQNHREHPSDLIRANQTMTVSNQNYAIWSCAKIRVRLRKYVHRPHCATLNNISLCVLALKDTKEIPRSNVFALSHVRITLIY